MVELTVKKPPERVPAGGQATGQAGAQKNGVSEWLQKRGPGKPGPTHAHSRLRSTTPKHRTPRSLNRANVEPGARPKRGERKAQENGRKNAEIRKTPRTD